MAWYKTGTVTVTNGSAVVAGSGTLWMANARRGEVFRGPDFGVYEIGDVNNNGQITLASTYRGANAAGAAYAIAPTHSYIRELTTQVAALIAANQASEVIDDRRNLVERGLMTKLWSYRMAGNEPVYSSPVGPVTLYSAGVPHQCVLLASWDWYVYALKVSDGTMLWRYATGANCYGRCQAADVNADGQNEVFAPSHDGNIYSLNSSGTTLRWAFKNVYDRKGLPSTVTGATSTTLTDTARTWLAGEFLRVQGLGQGARVVFTSGAAAGQKREITANAGGNVLTVGTMNVAVTPNVAATAFAIGDAYYIEPRYVSDKYFMHAGTLVLESGVYFLYVTGFDNHVYKLNANTGALVWEFVTGENIEPYPLVADINGDGSRECVVVSIDGKVRSLDAATGALLWQQTEPGACDAFLNAANLNADAALEVIVSSRNGRVYSLGGTDGAVKAKTTNTYGLVYGDIDSSATPILLPGETDPSIVVGGDAGGVWCFDKEMATRWQRDLVPHAINSTPVFHDVLGNGDIAALVGDMRGTLHCYEVATGTYVGNLYLKGGIEGTPLYADIDGDGRPELVITTTDGYVECYRFTNGALIESLFKPGNTKWAGKQV